MRGDRKPSPVLPPERVPEAFDRGAGSYDTLVAANPGYHAHLRRSARRLGLPPRRRPAGARPRLRHRCVHRGAAARPRRSRDHRGGRLGRHARAGRPQALADGVRFVHAPAEDLAEAGVDGPFDAVFAAYLFRNLTDPDAVLRRCATAVARRAAGGARVLAQRPGHPGRVDGGVPGW